jgi:hypothetical protein
VKLIHGGVMVRRRPPHPLAEARKRPAPGRKPDPIEGREEASPDANLARLMKVREDNDQTKGLISSPGDNRDWQKRFGALCRYQAAGKPDGPSGDSESDD